MLTALCIILILLTILSFSIISEVKVNLDLSGENAISFFLFGIKVIQIDVLIFRSEEDVFKLELRNKDKLIKSIGLSELNRANAKESMSGSLPNPFLNLDIIELEFYAEYGGQNAFATVLIIMAIKFLIEGVHIFIASNQRVKVLGYIMPAFDSRKAAASLSGIFCITIADIIYGIIFGKRSKEK